MNSEIFEFERENGEKQRVQRVRWDSWQELNFLTPSPAEDAFDAFCGIYQNYLVPAGPWIFGHMVLFHLPEKFSGTSDSEAVTLRKYTEILQKGVSVHGDRPRFRNPEAETLYRSLEAENCLRIISGKLPATKFIPVGNIAGRLSSSHEQARLKVNSSFFIMDCFDAATKYDVLGTPFGLAVKDGTVLRPPLFGREALMVRKDGGASVEKPGFADISVILDGRTYKEKENAEFFSRPEFRVTSRGKGTDLVIVGREIRDVLPAGRNPVPASGFVMRIQDSTDTVPGAQIEYGGMDDVLFGIQVGNSTVTDGVPSKSFSSRFYNIYRPYRTEFPPSLYPLDYDTARAARTAIGADRENRPVLIWAEGRAKYGHEPGKDSCGASLSELADICAELGMYNGVNMDGGGSAQILIDNRRSLRVCDRSPKDFSETERPVPSGLFVL